MIQKPRFISIDIVISRSCATQKAEVVFGFDGIVSFLFVRGIFNEAFQSSKLFCLFNTF